MTLYPVHPRKCGECVDGGFGELAEWRFIPASAGSAILNLDSRFGMPVHPRKCGECIRLITLRRLFIGSSPQVRGVRRRIWCGRIFNRFIPASAGSASASSPCEGCSSVHPRKCGECSPPTAGSVSAPGSSPQVRGVQHQKGTSPGSISVHPRKCGECVVVLSRNSFSFRFIPASAGSANELAPAGSQQPVHPRKCGECEQYYYSPDPAVGSSPQVRGVHGH